MITNQYLVYTSSHGARMLMRPCLCTQAELVARWNELPQAVKAQIRQLLLSTLASEVKIDQPDANFLNPVSIHACSVLLLYSQSYTTVVMGSSPILARVFLCTTPGCKS